MTICPSPIVLVPGSFPGFLRPVCARRSRRGRNPCINIANIHEHALPRSVAHLIGFCLLLLFCSLFYPLFTTLFLFGFDYFVFIYIFVFTLSVFLYVVTSFFRYLLFFFFCYVISFRKAIICLIFLSHLILFRGFLHKIRFLYFVLSVYFPIKTKSCLSCPGVVCAKQKI